MSSPAEKIDIVVGDFPADAALFRMNGVRTLFMGQGQTFTRAVDNVMNVLPGITREAAERMIREQCPEFPDLDDMLGLNAPIPPSIERPPVNPKHDVATEQLPAAGKRRRKAYVVAALLPALAASWALGRYTNVVNDHPVQTKASAPDITPDAAGSTVENAPFTDDKFDYFSGASEIECNPVSALEAECTDADGMVMSTKAATGPDSTIFTFSYGAERIGLRIFYDADYAKTWARQDGSRELYPHMKVHGRYVLWGTDQARIAEYMGLLQQADRDTGPSVMGGATPLPPRLAALTLGTLGLDSQQVHQIIARPAMAATDAPSMIAARLVLGLDTRPLYGAPGHDDIVALAIGIEPPPTAGGGGVLVPPAQTTPTAPSTPTGTPSAPSTPSNPSTPSSPSTPSTPSGPSTPSTPPAETTPPAAPTPPATPTPPAAPTPPTDTTSPPPTDTTPPADETPAPPVEPPVEETPTPPVEETPAPPVEETPAPPVEETPPPVEDAPAPVEETPAPVEEAPAPVEDTPAETPAPAEEQAPPTESTGQVGDELLILDSAWTVATAA